MARCPTLVVAGTHSGSGKTSISLALTRALARRGFAVQTFKTGPDFLDPSYLALASGRPCHNLDSWMAGKDHIAGLFADATADADCAIVEGVMGLFDGAAAENSEGSTAEIARLLSAPILLIVNVHGMGRSVAALVKGFVTFESDLPFTGVVANHAGSERHAAWISDALKAAGLPPLVGAIPRGAFPTLESRHLGLVTADGKLLSEATLDRLADALEGRISIAALFPELPAVAPVKEPADACEGRIDRNANGSLDSRFPGNDQPKADMATLDMFAYRRDNAAETSSPRQESLFPELFAGDAAVPAASPGTAKPGRSVAQEQPRIGVARDEAFHFYYQALFDALTAVGGEVCFFSPLRDERLPEGLSGLYLGGGYPEIYAEGLAANEKMRAAIRDFAASGRPLYAECGGLIYLSQGLQERDDRFHPFLGLLPARARMRDAKKALGYVEVTLREDSLWGKCGETFRGHEFHYSELIEDPAVDPSWRRIYDLRRRRSETIEREGFQKGNLLASYTHLYYAAHPAAVAHFLKGCKGDPL